MSRIYSGCANVDSHLEFANAYETVSICATYHASILISNSHMRSKYAVACKIELTLSCYISSVIAFCHDCSWGYFENL